MKTPHDNFLKLAAIAVVVAIVASVPAHAQSQEELAKKLANPVASLISVPLQGNFDVNFKPFRGFKYTLNVQPVVPIALSANWNMISRTILPITAQYNVASPDSMESGLGDIVQSLFFSPARPSKGGLVWGAGPVFLIPTATHDSLGAKKWGLGPTAVALKQSGSWTFGLLVNHIWSVRGDAERPPISATFFQPFISRAYKGGFTWTVSSENTQNWKGDVFSGMVGAYVAQIVPVFGQLVQVSLGPKIFYGNASVRPRWGFRANLTFLFPKK